MYNELKKIEGMTNKEIMYVVASEWIDDIMIKAVKDADSIMENEIVRSVICQAAESKLRYEEYRKEVALGKRDKDEFWYSNLRKDFMCYKTVVYDNLFRELGANSHNL